MIKINRKTVLSTAAVLGVAALVAGGTIAYFTDSDTKTNNFTLGNVDIKLYESQLHRVNANMASSSREGTLTSTALASDPHVCSFTNASMPKVNPYCTPNIAALSSATGVVSAWDNGHVRRAFTAVSGLTGAGQSGVFSDAQIIADSESTAEATVASYGGYADYVADEYNNLVPGKQVRKFVYVKNEDTVTPAYVRIKVTIPQAVADSVTVKIPSTPFTAASTAVGELNDDDLSVDYNYFDMDAATQAYYNYVETNKSTSGMSFTGDVVLTFVVHDALNGGEMTYWSPINTVAVNSDAKASDFNDLTTAKQFGITVDAEAIQAGGFASAAEAFAAYDVQN